MKNILLLEHYYSPDELTHRIKEWVHYYNYERYHERFAAAITQQFDAGRYLLWPSASQRRTANVWKNEKKQKT